MENKNYNDFPTLDDDILEKLAKAYAVAFDVVKKETTDSTVESLLTEILKELKLIQQQMERNKKIRLS